MFITNDYPDLTSFKNKENGLSSVQPEEELDSYSRTVVRVSETVSPSVVHIKIKKTIYTYKKDGLYI